MNECPGSALLSFHSEQCSLIQLDLLVRGRSQQVCDVREGGGDLVVLSCLRMMGFVFSERLCGTALAEACLKLRSHYQCTLRWDRERGWMGGVWASGQPELPGHLLRRPHLSEKHLSEKQPSLADMLQCLLRWPLTAGSLNMSDCKVGDLDACNLVLWPSGLQKLAEGLGAQPHPLMPF